MQFASQGYRHPGRGYGAGESAFLEQPEEAVLHSIRRLGRKRFRADFSKPAVKRFKARERLVKR
jgi:hypothetical protein